MNVPRYHQCVSSKELRSLNSEPHSETQRERNGRTSARHGAPLPLETNYTNGLIFDLLEAASVRTIVTTAALKPRLAAANASLVPKVTCCLPFLRLRMCVGLTDPPPQKSWSSDQTIAFVVSFRC